MEDRFYRDAYVEVDLDRIYRNYLEVQRLHEDKTFIAVVKSNAYGHGAVRVSQFLEENGVDFFAVGTLDEAIELRMHGIKSKILILGIINPEHINKAIQHRIALTAPNLKWLEAALKHNTGEYDKNVWIHIKVNSHMNRYGTDDVEEIKEMIEKIEASDHFVYEGIFSHLALAASTSYGAQKEIDKFKTIVESVKRPQFVHVLNSAGSLLFDGDFTNAVRVGISLYGYYPSLMVKEKSQVPLNPALRLITQVVDTHELKKNDFVGYDETFIVDSDTKIATIPIGYGDGLLRKHTGYTVKVNDKHYPFVGRICMDAAMIEVDAKVGDEVIIIDNHYDSPQSLERFSEHVGTIPYESTNLLTRRLPRVYKQSELYDVSNEILK